MERGEEVDGGTDVKVITIPPISLHFFDSYSFRTIVSRQTRDRKSHSREGTSTVLFFDSLPNSYILGTNQHSYLSPLA